ncbi:MAG: choice-of-anchor E domain-containing protein [Acidimicrobiales bacterium]|nr:choice-of-anchor E domain-containing protein [Acidimicrobiales bacterium]
MRLRRAFGAIVSTALVTTAGLGWQAGSAGAATAATTASINPADAGWTGNLHIPRFDPANGSLVSAEVTVTVTTEATIKLENLESFPVTSDPADPNAYEIAIGGDVDFDLAAVPGLAEIGFPDPVFAEVVPSGISLAAFDGVTDFGGPSGYTKVLTATSVRTATATDLESLAPFIGTGELVIAATSEEALLSLGGGKHSEELAAKVGVDIAVEYTYQRPAIEVELSLAEGQSSIVARGSTVSFTLKVRNAGELALTSITLHDDAGTSCDNTPIAALGVGEELVGVICELESIDAAVGSDTVTVTMTANGQSEGPFVTDRDSETITVGRPQLSVSHAPVSPSVTVGSDARFTTTITNTGNVELTDVVTEDVGVADCARPIGAIAVGAAAQFTCTSPGASADVVSVLTVKGDSVVGAPAPATAQATVTVTEVQTAPGIELDNAINGDDADAAPGVPIALGGTAALSAVVRNTGTERLDAIAVIDDLAGPLSCPAATLAVGAEMVCTVPATAVDAIGAVSHRTSVSATGERGATVADEDLAVYRGTRTEVCTASTDLLVGLRFQLDDGPFVGSLAELDPRPGDTINVRWDGYAAGQEGCQITLAQHATSGLTFDRLFEQPLVQAVTCLDGVCPATLPPGGPTVMASGHGLTMTVVDSGGANQFDLVTGPALPSVGPIGGYYSRWLNGSTHRLLSAVISAGA